MSECCVVGGRRDDRDGGGERERVIERGDKRGVCVCVSYLR